jgi:hypothetical protein
MNLNSLCRLAASLLLAAGLIAGSLDLGAGDAPPASAAHRAAYYADDELPAYPNAMEYPLGQELAVNGVAFRLSHFSTPDSPERVRDYYLAVFEQWKVPVKVHRPQGGGFNITATVGGGASQAVVAIAPRKDVTEVFPSVFPLQVTAAEPVVDDTRVPFSPSAVGIMKVADKADSTEAFTWQEPTMTVAGAAAYFKDELPKRGWAVVHCDLHFGKGGAEVSAIQGGRRVTLHLSPYRTQPQGASVLATYDQREEQP